MDKGKFPLSVKKQWQMWDLSGRGVISSQIRSQPVVTSLRGTAINYFWETPRGRWIYFPLFSPFLPIPNHPPHCPFPLRSCKSPTFPFLAAGDATTKQQTSALAPRRMIHIHNSLSSTNRVVTSKWLPRSTAPCQGTIQTRVCPSHVGGPMAWVALGPGCWGPV